MQIHRWDWLDLMNDFDEVAALMTALDLVVAPFNAVVDARAARSACRTVTMGNRYGWCELGTGTYAVVAVDPVVHPRMPNEEWDDVLATAARRGARRPSAAIRRRRPNPRRTHVLDLNGSTILLTGGTGSFGNAFVERVIDCWPDATVRVYSRDELKQSRDARPVRRPTRCATSSATCATASRMTRAVEGADIVVHAAAMKQVPACEYNPFEAVRTNVLGAQHVVDAAIDAARATGGRAVDRQGREPGEPLRRDEAVRGEDLRAGQRVRRAAPDAARVRALRQRRRARAARSSRCSSEQLERDGRITITDERMTRFWITLPQAVDLVLYALENMEGGEVFVPKIPSMQRRSTSPRRSRPACRTSVIGIRPGEKLHEMLITSDEARHTIDAGDVYVVLPEHPWWDAKGSEHRRPAGRGRLQLLERHQPRVDDGRRAPRAPAHAVGESATADISTSSCRRYPHMARRSPTTVGGLFGAPT